MSKQNHTPDSLADRLDEVLPPDTLAQAGVADDPLVEAAAQVAHAPRPELPPAVLARIQAQVLDHYQQQIQPPVEQPAPRVIRLHPALRWALVASFVVVVLFAASIPPALASVPGDVLYPVKQVVERVELGLATSPQAQTTTYLNFAERRTQELEILLERGSLDSRLVDSALDSLIEAADSARSGGVDIALVQTRTIAITAQLNSVLQAAVVHNPDIHADTVLGAARATQASGALLLPPPPQPTLTPQAVAPTQTPLPAQTDLPSPAVTAAPVTNTPAPPLTLTPQASATSSPTELPVNLVIEGPIEAIIGNIIIIYGIEIEVPVDDPLLGVVVVGDIIRVDGSIQTGINETGIVAVDIETINVETVVNPNDSNQVWRDTGDCSNPPPPWAPASGWRARCGGGGQVSPGNSGNNNSGGNSGRGNQGRGRGNNDDDDD